jgi:leader peptidase (prepilin peptidase)/N-methyltransferase
MAGVAQVAVETATYGGFVAGTAVIAVIDARTHRVPNKIVYPLASLGLVGLSAAAALASSWSRLELALCAGAAAAALFSLLWWYGGLGLGDVRLAGVIGLYVGYLGWRPLILGMFGGLTAAALVALVLLALGRGRKYEFSYGPYLIAGAWIGLLIALG